LTRLSEKTIYNVAYNVLLAVGTPPEHADTVANHLVTANLTGHDSHGIMLMPYYVQEILAHRMDPRGEPEIVGDTISTASVNGNGTFGQIVAGFATDLAIEKAKSTGISIVTMSNLGHTGRNGTYPEMAAKEGMAAIMFTGLDSEETSIVAPFGGREGRLGTNPITMAFPYKENHPILSDFATSMAAEGKISVFRDKGKTLPGEWILNNQGKPSRNPTDLWDGGAILPMGGVEGGHKGYGLSFMVALIGGMVADVSHKSSKPKLFNGGSTIIVISLEAMAEKSAINAGVNKLVEHVKNTPLMENHSKILLPGELEVIQRLDNSANGIYIPEKTISELTDLLKRFELNESLISDC
jgi:LDH2 family malate/lactate/ureidoglycolate dehydrogenase